MEVLTANVIFLINMLNMKNSSKIKFIIFGSVGSIIIWILILIFSKKIGLCIVLPILAFVYWVIDFFSSGSGMHPMIVLLLLFVPSILYCAGLGLISGILAFKLWAYKERWMAQKSTEYLPQSKLNRWNLISFLGITLMIVFCITFYTMFCINLIIKIIPF